MIGLKTLPSALTTETGEVVSRRPAVVAELADALD